MCDVHLLGADVDLDRGNEEPAHARQRPNRRQVAAVRAVKPALLELGLYHGEITGALCAKGIMRVHLEPAQHDAVHEQTLEGAVGRV